MHGPKESRGTSEADSRSSAAEAVAVQVSGWSLPPSVECSGWRTGELVPGPRHVRSAWHPSHEHSYAWSLVCDMV